MSSDRLIDLVVRAALYARMGNVKRTQVSKLLEIVWSSREEDLYEELILHITRQVARGEIDRDTGRMLVKLLNELKSRGEWSKERVARYIGLFRWAYDSLERQPIRIRRNDVPSLTFEGFLKVLNYIG